MPAIRNRKVGTFAVVIAVLLELGFGFYFVAQHTDFFGKARPAKRTRPVPAHVYGGYLDISEDKAAIADLKKAAAAGDAHSQYKMGLLYQHGYNFTKPDRNAAMDWYLKAANRGHARAQGNLGFQHEYGDPGRPDYKQALTWYLKSAAQNHHTAQHNLALIYYYGRGTAKDLEKSAGYFIKSAANGDSEDSAYVARGEAGCLFAEDIATTDPIALACLMALPKKNPRVDYLAARLYEEGAYVKKSADKALHLYLQAAQNGHQNSQLLLAERYESGQGVTVDPGLSYDWLGVLETEKPEAYSLREAVERKEDLLKRLPERGKARARALATEYIAKYGLKPHAVQPPGVNGK